MPTLRSMPGPLKHFGVHIWFLVDTRLGGSENSLEKAPFLFSMTAMRSRWQRWWLGPRRQTAYPRVRGSECGRPINSGHLSQCCGTSVGEDGRCNCIGLLPQKAILIGAFGRSFALETSAACGIFAIAPELSAATLCAGHSASASLAHALLWGLGLLRVWRPHFLLNFCHGRYIIVIIMFIIIFPSFSVSRNLQ